MEILIPYWQSKPEEISKEVSDYIKKANTISTLDFSNIKDFKYYDYISPAHFVNEKWCSTFICWADDDIVCQNQGEPMAEKLQKCVPYFDSYHVKGFQNNHCFHLNFGMGNKPAVECMNIKLGVDKTTGLDL